MSSSRREAGHKLTSFVSHVGEVSPRIDAVQFAGFDERGDTSPIFRPVIVASEECIFRFRTIGRMLRSTMLVSSSMRPSSRKRVSPSQ
jgi:hypothetical protein